MLKEKWVTRLIKSNLKFDLLFDGQKRKTCGQLIFFDAPRQRVRPNFVRKERKKNERKINNEEEQSFSKERHLYPFC